MKGLEQELNVLRKSLSVRKPLLDKAERDSVGLRNRYHELLE